MPLTVAQGLPDWLRSTNPPIPTGTLVNMPVGQALAGDTLLGPFLVSSYQSLVLSGFGPAVAGRGLLVNVFWYADAAATISVALNSYDVRNQVGFTSLNDAIPVLAPYCTILLRASIPLTINGAKVTATIAKAQGADIRGQYSVTLMFQQVIAAGAVFSAQLPYVTPGRWQAAVFVGVAFAAGGVAAIPWTLDIDEWYYSGGSTPIALMTADAPVPANRQGKSEVFYLSQSSTVWTLRNDSAGAQSFTVNAIAVGQS